MRTSNTIVLLACLMAMPLAYAAQPDQLEEVPEAAPDPVGPMEDGKAIEPDVTIVKRKDSTVEEYRVGGRLYMVKVTPFIGPSYYLLDNDGDGRMESRVGGGHTPNTVVPQWVIFSW